MGLVCKGLGPQVVGGKTPMLIGAILFASIVSLVLMSIKKETLVISKYLLTMAISMGGILLTALILWTPYFVRFSPQQSEILWVTPTLRTTLGDFFGIYGFFMTAIGFGFVLAYEKELIGWIGSKDKKWKFSLDKTVDGILGWFEKIIHPDNAVQGMLSIGLVTMMIVIGASWIHFTDPPEKAIYSQLIATVAGVLLMVAIFLKNRLEAWMAFGTVVLIWLSALVIHLIHLFQDSSFTLNLFLFPVLWLCAFFHLGMSIKVFKNRNLSFSYLMVSMLFFIIATLEVFVMKEYLGGDYLRNNSLFKFGINAWTLGAISSGIFLPKVIDFFKGALKIPQKESPWTRKVLMAAATLLLFVLIRAILDSFLPTFNGNLVSVVDIVLIAGFLSWALIEHWFKNSVTFGLFVGISALLMLFSFFSMPFLAGSGNLLAFFQRWTNGLVVETLFPALLAVGFVFFGHLYWEGKKDSGRRVLLLSWSSLLLVLTFAILIYPIASTERKCHGFFNAFRRQWTGYAEDLTLNGLAYLPRVNPYDAAAIRFLNEHIPDQPCLVEFVGEGYNSWGSRFSIFTGIPALMGWDGHVREWLTGRTGMEEDINQRFQATEQIFRTTDPLLAKKYMDAYGVRLVMVGTVERNGVPGRKGGYPPEGLAKFPSFLPLIYKNPQVEIYYNPLSANGS